MVEHNYFDLGRPLAPSDPVIIDDDLQADDVGHLGKTPPRSPADRLKHLKKVRVGLLASSSSSSSSSLSFRDRTTRDILRSC